MQKKLQKGPGGKENSEIILGLYALQQQTTRTEYCWIANLYDDCLIWLGSLWGYCFDSQNSFVRTGGSQSLYHAGLVTKVYSFIMCEFVDV